MAKRREEGQPWPMNELQEMALEVVRGDKEIMALPSEKLQEVIIAMSEETAKEIGKDLAKRAPKMLAQRRKDQVGFEARNFRRWREAFDLAETIWVCCEEVGRNFNQHFRPEAIQTEDFVFEAMTSIHAKSLLVAAEMICLMKGGFADAALTRWRTMHELNVVAVLLSREGQELALRYLAHADVQAAKDVTEEELEGDEDLQTVKRRSDYAISQFGDELKKRYGWACALTQKKQPNFEDLEKLAGKADERSLYKHASRHIHSNHRACDEMLGVSESEETLLLVGPSNSGMTGPLTLATMSMVETTTLYLATKANFDRTVYILVLLKMSGRIHKLASRLERKTFKAAQKRRAAEEKQGN